jgi:hypothetical protein
MESLPFRYQANKGRHRSAFPLFLDRFTVGSSEKKNNCQFFRSIAIPLLQIITTHSNNVAVMATSYVQLLALF